MNKSTPILGSAEVILESITDAFFAVDSEWRFTYINQQAQTVLAHTPQAVLGKSLWEVYPGLIDTEFGKMYLGVAASRRSAAFTSYYPEHARWYEVNCYPAPEGLSIYFRNVTERVHGEEKLRQSELHFRLMANSIPQIVWIADAKGQVEFFNEQWYSYTGTFRNLDHAGQVSAAFIHPDDQAPTMQAWEQALETGGTFRVEHRIRSAAEEYRWFLVRAEPHRDDAGNIVRWYGTSTDIHDKKQTERELARVSEESERRRRLYETFLSHTPDLAYVFDLEHRFIYANEVLLKMWGRTWDEAIGKTCLELGYEPWHAEMHDREIEQVKATRQPIRGDVPFDGAFGRRIYDYIFVPILGPDGEVEAVAGTTRDVTERKEAEEALREASRRKDEFLAMLAHELRNPLAPISAAAELMEMFTLDGERLKETCHVVSRQVRHMTELIDDLLDVSRVTRGLVEIERSPQEVKAIISSAVEQARPLIEAKRHLLTVELAPESAYILGDQKRLVQILVNLLNNAAKYTPEGGSIHLGMQTAGGVVSLSVADNGIGIAADLQPHLFELFAQAERKSDRSQGGLGIGLALVRSLVELHGGKVVCMSEGVGKGSRFTVTLPSLNWAADTAAQRPGARRTPVAKDSMRVLVVDDNTDAARMMALFLEAAGHQVRIAHDPAVAMELVAREAPDVCLLDIGLPTMDGNELARRLRAKQEMANAMLIAVTGYGQEQDRQNAMLAGFDHHLVKPVDVLELVTLISEVRAG